MLSQIDSMKLLHAKYPEFKKASSSDWAFNALMCELLAENGKAVGIMTNGSAWNAMDTDIRRRFVEEGLIEAVIALPGKMFYHTNIATSMIVLSRGNKSVRLVDATSIYEPGRRQNTLNAEAFDVILDAIAEDGELSRSVTLEELRGNNYDLTPSHYGTAIECDTDMIPMESVIKSISRGASCNAKQLDEMSSNKPTSFRYLRLSDIVNGMITNTMPYLQGIDDKYSKYVLKRNMLIISKMGSPFKIAVAEFEEGTQILASANLYLIELNDEADPYYIKSYLESKQGSELLSRIAVGSMVATLPVEKIRTMSIPAVSLEEQQRIAKEYRAAQDNVALLQKKLKKALDRLEHIYDEESGERKC